jgi:DNA-binding Lrp family transcriptional regulator
MALSISLPKFNHPEVIAFYEHDLSIPQEKVSEILALPRETLIQDMEMMIDDVIERYEFFQDYPDEDKWWELPEHALWVLVELDAKESLPKVLEILNQDDEFMEFWFGDYSTENFWEILYYLGGDSLGLLRKAVMRPGDWIGRLIPCITVEQIGIYHPERRGEMIAWLGSIMEEFSIMTDQDPALDYEVITSLVDKAASLKAKELLPVIKSLFKKEWVIEEIVGTYQMVHEEIMDPQYPPQKLQMFANITERYEDGLSWHGYRMRYDEAYKKRNTPKKKSIPRDRPYVPPLTPGNVLAAGETYKREGKKVGRNDPCPCGSGRKYKKCCLNK